MTATGTKPKNPCRRGKVHTCPIETKPRCFPNCLNRRRRRARRVVGRVCAVPSGGRYGIGSARHLARLCEEHLAYRWLCGGVGVNAKTLADFRIGHGGLLEALLIDSVAALMKSGVARLERVAQDGVRVRASAGAASFRRASP